MKFTPQTVLLFLLVSALRASATVAITSPTNNSTVSSSVQITASSSTTCVKGVASVGIYVDNALTYVVAGNQINTAVPLTPGKHSVVVQEWDYCGGATNAPLTLTVPTAAGVQVNSPAQGATVGTPAQ